jgi:hypothetical protein
VEVARHRLDGLDACFRVGPFLHHRGRNVGKEASVSGESVFDAAELARRTIEVVEHLSALRDAEMRLDA